LTKSLNDYNQEDIDLAMYLIKRAALLPIVCLLFSAGAQAATFGFGGTVTITPGSPPAGAVFPPLGTAATVSLNIDDSDPTALLFDLGNPNPFFQNITASVDIPGFLSGSMMNDGDFTNFAPTQFAFGAYGPAVLDQTGGTGFFPQGRHSFQLSYGPGVVQPTTVGDLIAALSVTGITGFFSHEMDRQGGGFFFTRVAFSDSIGGTVPLPGGMVLMLGALGLLGMLFRRKPVAV
jgi:hypothetical protein